MHKIIFLYMLFISFVSFSQEEQEKLSPFRIAVKERSNKFTKKANFQKAQTFFLKKEWDSTLVYTMKQLSVLEQNIPLNNYCHFFRGFSFKQKELFKEAKEEFSKIVMPFAFYLHVEMYLGEIALLEQENEKALSYFLKIEQVDDANLLGLIRNNIEENIGICYMELENYKESEKYLIKTVQYHESKKDNDSILLIGSYINMGNLYYEQYKDDLAIPYYEKAYSLAKLIDNIELKTTTAFNMSIVEEGLKNFSKSLIYMKEHVSYKDTLNDRARIWENAKIANDFKVQLKQDEVNALALENKLKIAERNGFIYITIILILILLAVVYFYKEKVKTNKIIVAQKEGLDELNATKDKLFSIVSHDLRSSVYALKTSNTELSENLEAKNLKALDGLLHTNSAIVNGAYNLLDNLLHWALLQTKQSYFEIAEMRLFFIVEQTAFNYKLLLQEKKIQFENKIPKSEMIAADQESLKIVLRNLLDNAIKFSKREGKITIYTRYTNNEYCDLVVEDTGIGMSEATCLELIKDTELLAKKENENIIGTGLGLQLCKSMIQKNDGKFTIESELGKGTKMIVSLRKNLPNGPS